jgi:trigger factor
MKHTLKDLPESQREIEVEISPEEFSVFENQALEKISAETEIKGFRKGTAPKEIIASAIGKEKIFSEAADMAVRENYEKIISENSLEPIGHPEVEILKFAPNNHFVFKIKIAVLPALVLPDYKKIAQKSKKNKVEVHEQEMKESLEWLRKSRAKLSQKIGPAQEKDFIEITYWSPQIKDINKDNPQKDSFVLGEGRLVSGFEKEIENMEAGQEKTFSVTMPENYGHKELAGKKVEFCVKMISVQKMELPELNDDFVKSVGTFENLDGLRKSLEQGILSEKENDEQNRHREEILDNIAKEILMDLPKILIEQEKQKFLESFRHNASHTIKIPFEEYLAKIGKTEKEILDSFTDKAKERVKKMLILRELGKQEKIDVSPQEVKEEADKILKQYPDVERVKFDPKRLEEYTKEAIITEKIFQLLENSSQK